MERMQQDSKNNLSEVGFEPTPSYEDQNSHSHKLSIWEQGAQLPWVWRLRPLGHPDISDEGGNIFLPIVLKKRNWEIKIIIPSGDRTQDLWIRSPTRYPLR